MVLRLVMTGLCAACVVLLATAEPLRIEVLRPAIVRERTPLVGAISVIDVASGVAPAELEAMLHLRSHEWVSAINDRPVDDFATGAAIAELAPRAGQYIDLTVSTASAERRVLVLMH
jgi:hypothetical protein